MTLRSVEMFTEYEPGGYVRFISPTPLLTVVALGDVLTVPDLALAAYERGLAPKRLVTIAGGHFDVYLAEFEVASQNGLHNSSREIAAALFDDGCQISDRHHCSHSVLALSFGGMDALDREELMACSPRR